MSPEAGNVGKGSRAYRLRAGGRTAAGMRLIALGRADHALGALRGLAGGGGDPETAIHDARKDLKKLRAVVRLLREPLGKRVFRTENARYRDAGRVLSVSRDADVKVRTLDALAERSGELPLEAVDAWQAELSSERERSKGMGSEAAVERAIALIEAGRDGIRAWPLENDSWRLVEPGVVRAYGRGREAMRRALAGPEDEAFHRWRKRAKDLWYQLRLLQDAWPKILGATAEQAHELTKLLGDHHDLSLLRRDLEGRRLGAEEREAMCDAISNRQTEIASASADLGRRIYAEKPKSFRRRLRAYWLAWRPE